MQELIGKVTKVEYITDDVIVMSFDVNLSFSFEAGQFISINIIKEDLKRMKSYSIMSPPKQKGKLDFCIKIIDGGFASEVFKKTKEGDSFSFKGPFGRFLFDESGDEHMFIGAGTGFTPFYSMILENMKKFPNKKFTLLMGYRYKKNILFDKELKELEKHNPNFEYKVTLTREPEWQGLKGRVQDHLPNDLQNKKFYICGLKEMVQETRDKLFTSGVLKENIEFERYN